jgi:hypothetical protein
MFATSSHSFAPKISEEELLRADSIPEPKATGIVYKVAENRQEREAAFRLIHQSYTKAGLIQPNPYGMRVTPYHLLDSTAVFVALYQGECICTLSLVGDGELEVPMASIYGQEIQSLRDQGLHFGEVSCLADRRSELARIMPVFVKLAGVMAQYARARGMDNLVIAVHPRHLRFYKRFMAFREMGDIRSYPTVCNNPAIACTLNFDTVQTYTPQCYNPYFYPALSEWELRSHPLSREDRAYFAPAAQYGAAMVPMVFD